MKSSIALKFDSAGPTEVVEAAAVSRGPSLGTLVFQTVARVTAVRLATDEADWLRAIGLFEGQTVRVVRRAPFGGPLHVCTGSGGEFAVDRTLASRIEVVVDEKA